MPRLQISRHSRPARGPSPAPANEAAPRGPRGARRPRARSRRRPGAGASSCWHPCQPLATGGPPPFPPSAPRECSLSWRDAARSDPALDTRAALVACQCSGKSMGEGRVILHLDADCFFVQVHVLRDPSLHNRPVAVQQHDDVIAANYSAKALGVKKHMAPHVARRLLEAAGGRLVHVPDDGRPPRTSYRIYREASESVEDALRAAIEGNSQVLERGHGMDEWFVDATRECDGRLERGAELAGLLRQKVRETCGITLSVGVAHNKFVAKLVASCHKPDGLTVAFPTGTQLPGWHSQHHDLSNTSSATASSSSAGSPGDGSSWPAEACAIDAEEAVRDASVSKVPGLGASSTHSSTLKSNGIATIGQLQDLGADGTCRLLGVPRERATALWQLAMGIDKSDVVDRPPQSMVEQMSLAIQDIGHIRPVPVSSDAAVARLMEMAGCISHRVARHVKRYAQAPTTLTLGVSAASSGEVRQKPNKGAAVQQPKQSSAPMPHPPTAETVGHTACRLLQRVVAAQGWQPDYILNKLTLTASSMEQRGASRSQPSVSSHFVTATEGRAAAPTSGAHTGDVAASAASLPATSAAGAATSAAACNLGGRKRERDATTRGKNGSDATTSGTNGSDGGGGLGDAAVLEAWVASRVRQSTLWGLVRPGQQQT